MILVPKSAAGARVDQFLPQALAEVHGVVRSRRAIRRAIDGGAVWLDGRRLRVSSRKVWPGQRLELRLSPTEEAGSPPPRAEAPRLEPESILYEDPWLLAIDKAAGLPSQATPTDALGNALAAARARARSRGEDGREIELCHRLDRGTSGVLLLAKGQEAVAATSRAFAERRVEKRYRALVATSSTSELGDRAPRWTIDRPLAKAGRTMAVDPLGKEAITEVQVLEVSSGVASVEARPLTGRRHQIRVHLAAEGLPVLGDRLYRGPGGAEPREAERLMLHSASLALKHPMDPSRGTLSIAAPLPRDFESLIGSLRGEGPISG
ncbi:MAG: RluA family pseudouridine synthase [Acidobacteriota bacterium]